MAVLKGDVAFGHFRDVSELPDTQIERLKHYFLTYKRAPGPPGDTDEGVIAITHVYDRREALEVIERSREDYQGLYPDLRQRLLSQLTR